MNIVVNGEQREIPAEMPVNELLRRLEMPEGRIAVEVNKKVIRSTDWAEFRVSEGDRIEIVHFVGGG